MGNAVKGCLQRKGQQQTEKKHLLAQPSRKGFIGIVLLAGLACETVSPAVQYPQTVVGVCFGNGLRIGKRQILWVHSKPNKNSD